MSKEIDFEKLLNDTALAEDQDYYANFGNLLQEDFTESAKEATLNASSEMKEKLQAEVSVLNEHIAQLQNEEKNCGPTPAAWVNFKPHYHAIKEELNQMSNVVGRASDPETASAALENGWDEDCYAHAKDVMSRGVAYLTEAKEKAAQGIADPEELQTQVEQIQKTDEYANLSPEMKVLVSSIHEMAVAQKRLFEELHGNHLQTTFQFPNMFSVFRQQAADSVREAVTTVRDFPEKVKQKATAKFFGFLHDKFQPIVDRFNAENEKINNQLAKVKMEREVLFSQHTTEKIVSAILHVAPQLAPEKKALAAFCLSEIDVTDFRDMVRQFFKDQDIYQPKQEDYDKAFQAIFDSQADFTMPAAAEALLARMQDADKTAFEASVINLMNPKTRHTEKNDLLRNGLILRREKERAPEVKAEAR